MKLNKITATATVGTVALVFVFITDSFFMINLQTKHTSMTPITRPPPVCQSTNLWPSSLLVGQTQLEQYRRWRHLTTSGRSKNVTYDQRKYRYNVTVVQATRSCSDIRVRLDEYYDGKRTDGGSSFLALSDSPMEREVCSYKDYFNGTYAIWCPPPPPECAVLTIQLQYVGFQAYYLGIRPMKQLVLRRSICFWRNMSVAIKRGHANSPATWLRSGHSWTVGYVRGEPVGTLLDAPAICACIQKKFDLIVMVGSSHMRYKFDYLMTKCYSALLTESMIERKHGSASIANKLYFEVLLYGKQFGRLWKILQNHVLTNKSLVIVQTGAHPLAYTSVDNVLGPDIDVYVKVLIDLKRRASDVGFKIVVVTSPPYPDLPRPLKSINRNNYVLAALSRLLQGRLSLRDFTLFDEFGVILPLQDNDEHDCMVHYLCRDPLKGMHGDVGIGAFRLLMTQVCNG